ncbi:hypothetical protein B0A48_03907 [Cryoendolithus antarcticus]|uniref:Uncharacterized protein n=1 Tax=Cryoendolithus antarcticus TaxID=1507870 RepID=A0A1V8TGU9_9PEZI|nr:hypothetical protein B0A48_03907 [Cryoendolithus antarcticus]
MQESDYPEYAVTAAVRASGPITGPVRKNLITNGRFANGLTSWTSQNSNSSNITALNGLAAVSMSLASQSSKANGAAVDSTAILYQTFPSSNYSIAGVQFFLAVTLGVTVGFNDSCNVVIATGAGDNFYSALYTATTSRTVYAAGVINYDFNQLTVVAECVGRTDASLTYTNITLLTYAPSPGSTLNCAVTGNVIVNGGFNTALSPWAVSQTTSAQSAGVVSGQYVVRYAAGTAPGGSPVLLTQSISVPANEYFTLTADLYFTLGGNGDVCSVRFSDDVETLYATNQIYSSQSVPVSYSGRFGTNAAAWQIALSINKFFFERCCVDKLVIKRRCINKFLIKRHYINKLFVDELFVDKPSINSLFINGLFIDGIFIDGIFIDKLYVDKLYVDKLYVDKPYIDELYTDELFIKRRLINKLFIEHRFINKLFIKCRSDYDLFQYQFVNSDSHAETPVQILANGNFNTDLSSWRTTQTDSQAGNSFTWSNGVAAISMPGASGGGGPFGFDDQAQLTQTISGAVAGQAWFTSILFSFANVGDGCSLSASTDSEQLLSADYGFPSAHTGPVNASGIFKNTPSAYNVLIYCYNYDQGYDVTPTLDNIGLSVFNPSTGTNPIRPVATQVVANPGFDGGTFSPSTTSQTSGRADFSINNGRAQVQFTRIDSRYTTPAYIEQLLGHAAEASQHVTLTGDVYINIPNGGANCIATMGTNGDQMWIVQNIVSSQTYHVNLNYTTTQAGQYMELYTTCTGTQVCSTQFDNVMLTLNSF